MKVIPRATTFKLYDENYIKYNASGLVMYAVNNDGAYRAWENKFVLDMESLCVHFAPIIID